MCIDVLVAFGDIRYAFFKTTVALWIQEINNSDAGPAFRRFAIALYSIGLKSGAEICVGSCKFNYQGVSAKQKTFTVPQFEVVDKTTSRIMNLVDDENFNFNFRYTFHHLYTVQNL